MKIGILTSSRADYGIYLPLLEKLKNDAYFSLEIIAFGTHLSKNHGFTLQEIQKDNYKTIHTIPSLLLKDDSSSIATSYGITVQKFAEFWHNNTYDLVLCLGDRFEMSAAVQAGLPFGVQYAHLHGGETTLGAIDNIYRHQITLAAKYHFTASPVYSKKVSKLIGNSKNIFTVGSLSLDNIKSFVPIDKKTFFDTYKIPTDDYVLVTFHPETVNSQDNYKYANEMKMALSKIAQNIFVIITMPNADTLGSVYREAILNLKNENPANILVVENFGKTNYFAAMFYAKLLLGNTSSGIIEAASFGKYVVNVGNRQKGRAQSNNVLNAKFNKTAIYKNTQKALTLGSYKGENVYYKSNVAISIVNYLKNINENL